MKRKTANKSTFAIGGVSCSADSFVVTHPDSPDSYRDWKPNVQGRGTLVAYHKTDKTMIKRLSITGILSTLLQIGLYYFVLYFGWTFGQLIHEPTKLTIIEAIGFGVVIKLSIIIFGTMLLVTNILTAIVNRKIFTWTLLCIMTFIYLVGWGEDFQTWPWKTSLFLIAGIFTIFSKFFIDKTLIGMIDKIKARKSTNA
jgi:hypothetical protein